MTNVNLDTLTTSEMNKKQYASFVSIWHKNYVIDCVLELGTSKKDAKNEANAAFENWIGQAGDQARDENIMFNRATYVGERQTDDGDETDEAVEADTTEGEALTKINNSRETKAVKAFADDIKVTTEKAIGGFHFRLGTYILQIREIEQLDDIQRLTPTLRKKWHVDTIPTNRCSEAVRYVSTIDAVNSYLDDTGKKFTSLTALFAAMDKVAKTDETDEGETDEGEGDSEGDTLTLEQLVNVFVNNCNDYGFSLEDAMTMIIEKA